MVMTQVTWVLSYIQGGVAEAWKDNLLDELAKGESEVKTAEQLFSKIRNDFGKTYHDLAKWLSHYLYFFSFLFLLFYLHRRECRKVSHHKCHKCHITMMSHDRHGKIVHRPCSSCISSTENPTRTPSSSCHDLAKRLSHYLIFFSFSFLFFSYRWMRKIKVTHKEARDFKCRVRVRNLYK